MIVYWENNTTAVWLFDCLHTVNNEDEEKETLGSCRCRKNLSSQVQQGQHISRQSKLIWAYKSANIGCTRDFPFSGARAWRRPQRHRSAKQLFQGQQVDPCTQMQHEAFYLWAVQEFSLRIILAFQWCGVMPDVLWLHHSIMCKHSGWMGEPWVTVLLQVIC